MTLDLDTKEKLTFPLYIHLHTKHVKNFHINTAIINKRISEFNNRILIGTFKIKNILLLHPQRGQTLRKVGKISGIRVSMPIKEERMSSVT